MNKYNPELHHRGSIRLKGYDYSQEGLYFITICCQNRICRFGTIENGKIILNEYGIIAHKEWINTPNIRPNVELGEFIIMPNHIHGIIAITDRSPIGRGELHSPLLHSLLLDSAQINSPNLNSAQINSPLLDSSQINSPNLNSSQINSPNLNLDDIIKGEYHRGVCKTPLPNVGNTDEYNWGECNTDEYNWGECNSPLRSPSQTVGAIVRGYKSSVTKQLGLMGFTEKLWQRNYYEHIIRNDQSFQNISEYIINNPLKWDEDTFNPSNIK